MLFTNLFPADPNGRSLKLKRTSNYLSKKRQILIGHFLGVASFFIVFLFFSNQIIKNFVKISNDLQQHTRLVTNRERVTFITLIDKPQSSSEYEIALKTLKCYIAGQPFYEHVVLYDNVEIKHCRQKWFFFRRHCIISTWLQNHRDVRFVLFLDGDHGVINPLHRVEEFIRAGDATSEPGTDSFGAGIPFDLLFYDRFFSNEVMAGSYILRNTEYTRNFLMDWAKFGDHFPTIFRDNQLLHGFLLKKFGPPGESGACDKFVYGDQLEYDACCRQKLRGRRILIETVSSWSNSHNKGVIKVLKKGKGWSRDANITGTRFCWRDFFFHDIKNSQLESNAFHHWTYPFLRPDFDMSKCGRWRKTEVILPSSPVKSVDLLDPTADKSEESTSETVLRTTERGVHGRRDRRPTMPTKLVKNYTLLPHVLVANGSKNDVNFSTKNLPAKIRLSSTNKNDAIFGRDDDERYWNWVFAPGFEKTCQEIDIMLEEIGNEVSRRHWDYLKGMNATF